MGKEEKGISGIRLHPEGWRPITAISMGDMSWNRTGTWRYLRPIRVNKTPPCHAGCPAGEDIEGVLSRVREGRYEEALRLIRQENPFPAICGRVCNHPCEVACNRGGFDQPIAIHAIERFVAEAGYRTLGDDPPSPKTRPHRVAVIGGGPAGLTCAYHLARMGYPVDLFERHPFLGGMLRIGIPPYRLPKGVLDEEIERLLRVGIEVQTGMEVGKDLSFEDLKDYRALFLASGATRDQDLGIPGADGRTVLSGLAFLFEVNHQRYRSLEGRTVIIGGGNTAIDCARSALRLGSRPIVLYRRSRDEMPALESEVQEAEEEGVEIQYLVSPLKVHVEQGRIQGIECIRNRLGPPDGNGRRRPEPIENSHFFIETERVIAAIGEGIDPSLLPIGLTIKDQLVFVDGMGRSSRQGLYAGGDVASRLRMVVHAIGEGKRAAVAMDCDLRGRDPAEVLEGIRIGSTGSISMARYLQTGEPPPPEESRRVVSMGELNLDYFEREDRPVIPAIPLTERRRGFQEVHLTLSEDQARKEAGRCFHCAVCNQCGNCSLFCPDVAVILGEQGTVNGIDYDHCKGCGICAEECPRAVLSLEEEKR